MLRVTDVHVAGLDVTIRNGNGVGLDPAAPAAASSSTAAPRADQNSTVSGNTGTEGGGIAADGIAQLIGVTVSGNAASAGAAHARRRDRHLTTGGLSLGNSTVSGNTAVDDGGAARRAAASTRPGRSRSSPRRSPTTPPPRAAASTSPRRRRGPELVQNSLLSHGTGGACGGRDRQPDRDANVVSDATCQFKDPSNLQNVNPQIGALANNGGPTNTHALAPASPAIGRASQLRARPTSAGSPASRRATPAPTSTALRR